MSFNPSTPPSANESRSSDESSILGLSFSYERDENGKIVRVSKASSQSTPPTPPESYYPSEPDDKSPSPALRPSAAAAARPDALSRSESAPSIAGVPGASSSYNLNTGRSFQRVVSDPAEARWARKPVRVIRPTLEDHEELPEESRMRDERANMVSLDRGASTSPEIRPSPTLPGPAAPSRYAHRSASVSSVPTAVPRYRPARVPIDGGRTERAPRDPKHPSSSRDPAGEDTDTAVESENAPRSRATSRNRSYGMIDAVPPALGTSSSGRPRRSASFSDAATASLDDLPSSYNAVPRSLQQPPPKRPVSSMDLPSSADPDGYDYAPPGSPTYVEASHIRPTWTHQRKESDTLRSFVPTAGTTTPGPEALPKRVSPTAREYNGRTPSSTAAVAAAGRHRRNPTAPEAPTNNGMNTPPGLSEVGRTWAAGDGRERDSGGNSEYEGAGRATHQQQSRSMAPTHAPAPSVTAPAPQQVAQTSGPPSTRTMVVCKRSYIRLDLIGKGGSSRVYRVMSDKHEIFAVKRVSLEKADNETVKGYMNEIALLKRLGGNSRIIRLVDSEAKHGPNGGKGYLNLVMECGEIDLARLLQEQQKKPLNLVWVAYYWQQMLEAVHVIHEEKIVHSDLKPANFVLVQGQLKLIDFGIANAIANDTTNIQRDHQIGTVNYMSPEAIEVPEGMRRLKVGRPSDVWSLGCILYQMVYGHPPFFHLTHVVAKMRAIPDPSHIIDFPAYSSPPQTASTPGRAGDDDRAAGRRKVRRDVIMSMQCCLRRNPKERETIPDLLEQDWLAMHEPEAPPIPPVHEQLGPSETIIDPYYMRQLLEYGIRRGQETPGEIDYEDLKLQAERLVTELKEIKAQGG